MSDQTLKRWRVVLEALTLAALIGLWAGRSPAQNQDPADIPVSHDSLIQRIDKLDALNDKDRQTLIRDIDAYHQQVEEALEAQLNSKDIDTQFYAACMLGRGRFGDAASSLNSRITLTDDKRYHQSYVHPWFWSHYPAVEALVRIGLPSVPWMINDLATMNDPKVRQLALYTLQWIEEDMENDDAYTANLLMKAMTKERNPGNKDRLRKALETLAAGPIKIPD